MVTIKTKRLEKGKATTEIELNVEAIDFIAPHMDKEFAETTIAVLRSGVVLWLEIERKDLVKIMKAAK